mgnify:FL=1
MLSKIADTVSGLGVFLCIGYMLYHQSHTYEKPTLDYLRLALLVVAVICSFRVFPKPTFLEL